LTYPVFRERCLFLTWGDVKVSITQEITAEEVASIQSKNCEEIIEVKVPACFHWNENGSFDGAEFGEFKTTLQPGEEDIVRRAVESISNKLKGVKCKH